MSRDAFLKYNAMPYFKRAIPFFTMLLLLLLLGSNIALGQNQTLKLQCDQKFLDDPCLSRVCSAFVGNYDQLRGNVIRECLDTQRTEATIRATRAFELIKWTLEQQENVAGIQRYEQVLCPRGIPDPETPGAEVFCPGNGVRSSNVPDTSGGSRYLAELWWISLSDSLAALREEFDNHNDQQPEGPGQDINIRLTALENEDYVKHPDFEAEIARLDDRIDALVLEIERLKQQNIRLTQLNGSLTEELNVCSEQVNEITFSLASQKKRNVRGLLIGTAVGVAAGGFAFGGGSSSSSPTPPDFPGQ